jgi:uncharacterized membrane protein YozB (DUF420 family)
LVIKKGALSAFLLSNMLIVNFLKFIHLLLTLSLLGSVGYCLALLISKNRIANRPLIYRLNKIILVLAFFAMLTGTFLVHPKHFTFHTPWIQAAYILIVCFSLGLFALMFLSKKQIRFSGIAIFFYLLLLLVLVFIVHDAVTKTTFLFSL